MTVDLKTMAAVRALEYVHSDMVLGLGTGSTSARFIDALGQQLKSGALRGVIGVPTSEGTARRAQAAGIPLSSLVDHARLDLVVDGADEVDPHLDLIKGLGRALLREKIVAVHADRLLVIADESKWVARLGQRGPLPVEILPFAAGAHVRWLNTLGCRAVLWCEADGSPVITDNGNYLALCTFAGGIPDAGSLARVLADRPGIVEHGLFLGMASATILAGPTGVRVLERAPAAGA